MWDDHDREIPIRDARGIPTEIMSDQPSREGNKPRSIRGEHWIKLWEIKNSNFKELGAVQITPKKQGQLEGEFRYLSLKYPINLYRNSHYILTMSTRVGDQDHFHDHVAFDGLSPLVNPMVSGHKERDAKTELSESNFSYSLLFRSLLRLLKI